MTLPQQPPAGAPKAMAQQQIVDALSNGRFTDARALAEMALSDGEDGTILFLLGVACLRGGDPAAAVVPLRRVLTLVPEEANIHMHLGEALTRLGQVAEAQVCYRKASCLDPAHAEEYEQRAVRLGRAVHFHKQGRGEQGLHRDVYSLLADVQSAVEVEDFAHGLGTLTLFGLQVLELQRSSSGLKSADIALGHRAIDASIDALGARVLQKRGGARPMQRNKLTVHIATRLYTVGGHTRLMRSFMDADDTREQVVLLTDLTHSASERPAIDAMFPGRRLEWCPPGDQLTRLHWLMDRLEALAPERVMLFQHHHDPVAVAACQPELAPELYFMHHADYEFCFGVFHPRATHIDGSPMDFDSCRHRLHVANNIFVPFVAEDRPRNPAPLRPGARPLVTCTAATFNKLNGTGYRYNYLELFPWLFSLPVERHVHIGELPAQALTAIYNQLDAAGIPRERFDYRGNVPSYWHALRDASVDACIGSFPLGGGLTVIEAMGSGTPYISHINYQQRVLSDSDMLYPEGFAWRNLSELGEAIHALSVGGRVEHAEAARNHYMRFHQPHILKDALRGDRVSGVQAPAMRVYQRDDLQLVLDRFYAQ